MIKVCRRCGVEKPLTDFYARQGRCKSCCIEAAAERRAAHPEREAQYRAMPYSKAKQRAASKRWYEDNKGFHASLTRDGYLRKTYGITQVQYDEMLAAQGGACAVCRSTDPGTRWSSFHVDHDHATGAVRGLLCSPCNITLGQTHDSVERLMALAAYLMTHEDIVTSMHMEA